jgi:hypothetical protein
MPIAATKLNSDRREMIGGKTVNDHTSRLHTVLVFLTVRSHLSVALDC